MYNILYILENSCIFAEKRNMERKVIVYMDRLTNVVAQSVIDDMVRHGQAEDLVEINSAAGSVFVRLVSRDRGINIVKNDSGVPFGEGLFPEIVSATCKSLSEEKIRELVAFGGGKSSFRDGSLDEYRKVVLEVDMSHPDNKVREFKGYTPHEWDCFQFEAVPGVNFKKRCVECGKQFDIKIKE